MKHSLRKVFFFALKNETHDDELLVIELGYVFTRYSFRAKVPKGIDLETDTKMSSDQKSKVFQILSCQRSKSYYWLYGQVN